MALVHHEEVERERFTEDGDEFTECERLGREATPLLEARDALAEQQRELVWEVERLFRPRALIELVEDERGDDARVALTPLCDGLCEGGLAWERGLSPSPCLIFGQGPESDEVEEAPGGEGL